MNGVGLKPRTLRTIAALVGLGSLLALLAYGVSNSQPRRGIDAALARGERPPAPALRLVRLDAPGSASLADFRGRVVVLNYWASWCLPCRQESPLLERWQQAITPLGGTVLGIDALDITSDAASFIRQLHLTYPMLRDPDGDTQHAFGVTGYPETFVLDRRGRVAALRRGPVDEGFIARAVLPLLRERM